MASATPLNKVHIIQNSLKALGMPSNKWQELSLTAMAASQSCRRDPRAAAQFQRVFSTMDSSAQGYMEKVTEEIKLNPKEMAGVSAPLGFWDPLGLSTTFKFGQGA